MKIGVLDFVNGERRGDQEKQQPSVQGKEPQTNSTSVRCQGYGSGIKPGTSMSLLAAGGTCHFHLSHLSGTLFSTFLLRFRVVTSAEVAASKTSSGMLTAFLLLHKKKKIYS